jgi:hypothetical protein
MPPSRCWNSLIALSNRLCLSGGQGFKAPEESIACSLLNSLISFGLHQQVEYRQHAPPVIHHAQKDIAQLRIAFRFPMPLREYGRRHFYISAQSFRGMSAQKQPIEKRGLPLRIFQVRRSNRWHELDGRGHKEIAVYRKPSPRQVVPRVLRYVSINSRYRRVFKLSSRGLLFPVLRCAKTSFRTRGLSRRDFQPALHLFASNN